MLSTTFRKAKEAGACIESYKKFAKFKGGVSEWGLDKPFPLTEVLDVCGMDDALWSLGIVIEPVDKEIRLFACYSAERVLPIFEKQYPEDKRPRQAIEVSRRYANGEATLEELNAAAGAARSAAWAATWDATWDAGAAAARDAGAAAGAAARAAAWAAAWGATWDAAGAATWAAAGAAWDAGDAARAAARAAEREWQKQRLFELLREAK